MTLEKIKFGSLVLPEAKREQLREWGRQGGKARAGQPDFIEHQRRAGKRSAEVNDMAALGAKGAKAFARKYGYARLFYLIRNYRLAKPSKHERQVGAILDELGYRYEREAMVLGENIPLAVDFYLADAGDAVIEVNGRVHYDAFFDHPNYPQTRQQNDMYRIQRLERAGFRVLEIDYRELVSEAAVMLKIAGFLVG